MRAKNKKILIGVISLVLAIIMSGIGYVLVEKYNKIANMRPEDKRAMTYGELTEEDKKVEGTDYVQFSAFFTRKVEGDKYASKIKGTCKEIGETDQLYVDLNVLTKGYLKDGKITLNADNFTWKTSIVENNVFKGNYIGNTTVINLQDKVMNGSQELVWGDISASLGSNINNYSKVNSITLTGTHVIENEDGTTTETPINKTVNLTVDWYGETETNVIASSDTNNISTLVRNDKVSVEFSFTVQEKKEKLLLQKQIAEVTIPKLNGYAPTSVTATDSRVEYDYNEENGKLTITRKANVNEDGKITTALSRENYYNVKVEYPLEAYNSAEDDIVKLTFPITVYTYGYNNPNTEFTNPHVSSDDAEKIVLYKTIQQQGYIWRLSTQVGSYAYNKDTNKRNYVVSKEYPMNIYNGNNNDSQDLYDVMWKVDIGTHSAVEKITLEEQKENEQNKTDKFNENQSMYDYITTKGIYFEEASNLLGRNGWIKLYDAEDNELIKTFTENDWKTYKKESPYEVNLKSIKIETSNPVSDSNMYVYQIKEIDDELLTSRYTENEFNALKYIATYLQGTIKLTSDGTESTLNRTGYANYDIPYSNLYLKIDPSEIINQETKNIDLTISTYSSNTLEVKWKNGVFLIELPEEIIKLNVNSVQSSKENVKISNYYSYKQDSKYFIKIITENDENDLYDIVINADVTPNPLLTTVTSEVKVYGYNEYCDNYGEKSEDFYDIDEDNLSDDKVGYAEKEITLTSVGAAGILTTEYVTDYDDNASITIAPNIADIEKSDNSRTAKINISVTSNYTGTISEILVLGKVPFEGNTYAINAGELGSQFTANITGPISIPEDLREYVTIYYSEKGNATKDLTDANNGWTKTVTDWSKIKSYLIDFGDYVLENGENKIFNYEVLVPGGLGYNSASFSHHAVYYCLDTVNGKLEVSTEPNKVGIQVVGKYKINLIKNRQNNQNKLVEGATFSLTTTDADGKEVVKVAKTNVEGSLEFSEVYIDKEYTLKEISAPSNYALLKDTIKFKLSINANNEAVFNVIEGNFKETPTISMDEQGNYVVQTKLEDEPRYNLQITKNKINDNTLFVKNAKYTATANINGNETTSTGVTNENGIADIKGLYLNKEYTLKEISVNSDYAVSNEEIKFIGRLDSTGNLQIEVTSTAGFKNNPTITEENGIDVVKVNLEDEIRYTLNINKKGENEQALSGVKFTLTGNNDIRMAKSDSNGLISLEGLFVNATYELEETKSTGYYLFEEPKTFKIVRDNNGKLKIESEDSEFANAEIVETQGVAQATVTVDIQNEKIPTYTLQIVKVEENATETDLSRLTKLENAKFKVTSVDTEEEKDYTTDANGVIELDGLYQYVEGKTNITGEYKIEELEAPNGYSNNAEEITIVVKKTANNTLEAEVKNQDDLTTYKNVIIDGNKVILVLQDKPLFKLKKVDSKTGLPLANAEFIIYEVDETGKELDYGKDTNGDYVGTLNTNGDYTVTTDENGVISLPLRNGYYKAVEVTYPNGYQELGTEEFFKIEVTKTQVEENLETNDDVLTSIYQEEEIDESQYTILEIESIDDLVEFETNVNSGNDYKNYIVKLTKDLDFNDDSSYEDTSIKAQLIKGEDTTGFTPIGTGYNNSTRHYDVFEGIFDGQGHTISNLYIKASSYYVGLFSEIYNAKILNLNLSGEVNRTSSGGYIGGIIGHTYTSSSLPGNGVLIKNCTTNIDINKSVDVIPSATGGMVGEAQQITAFVNCTNFGTIKGDSYVGGIIGQNYDYPIKIINCKNEGTVSGKIYVGGIIGQFRYTSIIYNCSNSGKVSGTNGNNGYGYIGGITGYYTANGLMSKCYNTGKISDGRYVGGIIGYFSGSDSKSISNCHNTGDISCDITNDADIGGIIGYRII